MGLFSSGKLSLPRSTDKVWKTRKACLKGLVELAQLSIKNSELPIVFVFFEESRKTLCDLLTASTIQHVTVDPFSGRDLFEQPRTLVVMNPLTGAVKTIPKGIKYNAVFFGHYPNLAVESKVVEEICSHTLPQNISFCLSLDDPLLELFGGTNLKSLMEKIGMNDDECIEHPIVGKAIRTALEKLKKGMTSEIKAHSEREWFAMNVRR